MLPRRPSRLTLAHLRRHQKSMRRTLAAADELDNPYAARLREAKQIAATGHIPEQPARLTRRKRHLVVAADRWADHASVWFIRRGHSGEPEDEIIRLQLDGDEWRRNGSSGGAPGADIATRLRLDDLAGHFSRQYHHTKAEQIPFGFHTGSNAGPGRAAVRFQTVHEATTLTFSDREQRAIADHGYCIVVYDPKHPPTITALDAQGNNLGSFTPKRNLHPQHRWLRRLGNLSRRPRHRLAPNQRRRWHSY